jgi:hypothetical protein
VGYWAHKTVVTPPNPAMPGGEEKGCVQEKSDITQMLQSKFENTGAASCTPKVLKDGADAATLEVQCAGMEVVGVKVPAFRYKVDITRNAGSTQYVVDAHPAGQRVKSTYSFLGKCPG